MKPHPDALAIANAATAAAQARAIQVTADEATPGGWRRAWQAGMRDMAGGVPEVSVRRAHGSERNRVEAGRDVHAARSRRGAHRARSDGCRAPAPARRRVAAAQRPLVR